MRNSIRFLFLILLILAFVPVSQAGALTAQSWPSNGRLYENDLYPGKQTELDIYVQNQEPGYASVIKLCAADGTAVRCLFAGSTSGTETSFQIYTQFPGGDYIIKLGTGQTWYGLADTFGTEGVYRTLLLDGDSSLVTLDDGYTYVLYLDTSLDAGANDFETKTIPYSAF